MSVDTRSSTYKWALVWATLVLTLMLSAAAHSALAVTARPMTGSHARSDGPLDTPTASATISPTPFPACGLFWRGVASPNIANQLNFLNAVAGVASDDLWAVGYSLEVNTSHTLIMHWNGAQWTIVPSPDMGPLNSVFAMAPDHVWAVGTMGTHPNEQTLIMHWDGMMWDMMPSPNVGTFDNILYGVTSVAEDDAWAVGYYYNSATGRYETLTLHWRGADWVVAPSPNMSSSGENRLNSVSASSANDVWAAGTFAGGTQMLIMHWDGVQWSLVPGLGPGYLAGVTAISANDAWAVGNASGPLAVHWDGTQWSAVPTAPAPGAEFDAVSATAPNDVWAVGLSIQGTEHTLVEHWDGSAWSVSPSASLGTSVNFLYGVTALSTGDAWAVGYYANGGASALTQVLHYSDPCAPPTSTRTPTGTTIPTMTSTPRPTGAPNTPTATPCVVLTPFSEGFEGGTLNTFTSQVQQCSTGGCGWSAVSNSSHSGAFSAFAPNVPSISDQRMVLNTPVTIPADATGATLSFWHKHHFDVDAGLYYDGSVLEFSTNGGATWTDVLSSTTFIAGGYDGPIVFGHFNPLARRQAWGGFNASYPSFDPVVVNLLPFAGQNLLFRFRLGTDHVVGAEGWWVDDVQVNIAYACSTATPTITATPGPVLVGHLTWQGPPTQPSARQQLPITLTLKLGTSEWNYPAQTTDASGYFTVSVAGLSGSYNWRAKGPKYLANSGIVNLSGASTAQAEMGLMRAGDSNNDNVVNLIDFNILKITFGKGIGDPGYDARADFTNDDLVNIADVNLQKINFGQSGAPPLSR